MSAFRETLVEVLRDAGFQIVEAATGDAAVELLELPSVRLIVTDINMPGQLHGIALAFIARQSRPGIPVIFISGRPGELRASSFAGQSCGLLTKTVRVREAHDHYQPAG